MAYLNHNLPPFSAYIRNEYLYDHEKGYFSKAINTLNKNKIIYDYPIDTVSKDYSLLASINFRNLDIFKRSYGYGYTSSRQTIKDFSFNYDILIFNTEKKHKLCLRLDELETFKKNNPHQFIDHCLFNNSGSKIAFYHSFFTNMV